MSIEDLNVVVADDEQFSRSIFVKMLTDLNCAKVVQTVNGLEAMSELARLETDTKTILICDFNMPKMNGLQILKAIRVGTVGIPRDLKIIMLTGNGSAELVSAAVQLDVDAFLIKPISKNKLTSHLQNLTDEPTELKPADHYDAVDIDTLSSSLRREPLIKDVRDMPKPPPSMKGVHTLLEFITPGSTLTHDICDPNGKLVLSIGTVLKKQTLRRLEELKELLKIDALYVQPPGKK